MFLMFSQRTIVPVLALVGASLLSGATAAFDETCNSNVVAYWGQNSYGAANSANTAGFQQRLSYYCQDDSVDIIPISFLDVFTGPGNLPQINLANTCNTNDQQVFTGSQLLNCSFLADDIKTCQSKGKIVTLSLGGATGGGAADAAFADQVWNLFLGGTSSTRPFGDAVLDGIDLDIEGGSNSYVTFVNQMRTHFATDTSKKYYISAAPQCPYPDSFIGSSLNGAKFDMVYIQFYNNACGISHYSSGDFNFGTWDAWASTLSPNPDIKLYIGVPASTSAAGSGYVDVATLSQIASDTRAAFPHFGGIMYWDASQAWANNNFQQGVKSGLKNGGACGQQFSYPACSAPAWSANGNYPAGSKVSYQNYIWQAKFFGSGTPAPSDTGSWVPISACGGPAGSGSNGGGSPPPVSSPLPASSSASPSPVSSPASSPPSSSSPFPPSSASPSSAPVSVSQPSPTSGTGGSGSCSSSPAWSNTVAYVGGQTVSYNSKIWKASWWTQAEVPGTTTVWVSQGPCTGSGKRAFDRRAAVCGAPAPSPSSSSAPAPPSSSSPAPPSSSSPAPPSSSSLAPPSSSSPAPPTSTPSPAPPSGGGCSSAPAWSTSVAYVGGQTVSYNNQIWKASWWTEAEVPGTTTVWVSQGPCTARKMIKRRSPRQDRL